MCVLRLCRVSGIFSAWGSGGDLQQGHLFLATSPQGDRALPLLQVWDLCSPRCCCVGRDGSPCEEQGWGQEWGQGGEVLLGEPLPWPRAWLTPVLSQ